MTGPIEIVGLITASRTSEVDAVPAGYDAAFVPEIARAYEAAGFDRVLVGQNARSADSLVTASYVAAATTRLKLMVAHRPGFIAPTMAARALATLDRFSNHRAGVHIITAFSDIETRCDGDYLTKDQRYTRSNEYVAVLRRMWASTEPFDHAGEWYKCEAAFSEVHPEGGSIPVFWAGTSPLALQFGSQLADVYALGPGSVAQVRDQVEMIRAAAADGGRTRPLRFHMSIRLIVDDTDEAAWARANRYLKAVEERQAAHGLLGRDLGKAADDLVAKAAEARGQGADPQLWTGLTEATRGRTQIMCLVGSPDTLVDALMRYREVGIDNFLITGFDWLPDIARIGSDIAPALRARADAAAGVGA